MRFKTIGKCAAMAVLATGLSVSGEAAVRTKVDLATIRSAFGNLPAHPRLHVRGPEDLARFRDETKLTPEQRYLRRRVVEGATEKLKSPLVKSKRVGRRLDEGKAPEIVFLCAAAYGFTGDRRFAERADREMLSICDWPEWIPDHYLGTAEVMRTLAFGYDWTFDVLTDEEKAKIRKAMIERGYAGMKCNSWWRRTDNNWGQVCWQGVTAAAIAICEDDRKRSEKLLLEAVNALYRTAGPYAPNGAYPEGPGYWGYGTGRFVLALDQFEKAFGTTFDLYEQPGFAMTGEYENAMFGSSGLMFNYSDCGAGRRSYSHTLVYLARRAGRSDWIAYETDALAAAMEDDRNPPKDRKTARKIAPASALWTLLLAEFPFARPSTSIPLDYFGGGRNDVAAFRSDRGEGAFWLGVKGGSVSCNHGNMDVGSFVLDAKGERWAYDLGSQNYHSIEKLGTISLWNMAQDSSRWTIFRQGPLSHNLVTIDGQRLVVKADARIVPVRQGEITEVTLDLTPVYGAETVKSARRTFVFDRTAAKVTVKDAFTGLKPGAKARWQLVTKATCAIAGKNVTLSIGKKSVVLGDRLRAAWETQDISKGLNSWDCANAGFTELVSGAIAPESGELAFEMEFSLK